MFDSIRFPLTSAGVVATVALLSATGANAQGDEEEFDRTPRDCLAVSRIRNTDILDDRTILFFLRGNKLVYRTYLPHECPGLERNDRFAYEARNGQLCDVDVITVLEQMGVSLHSTFTCRLGKFIPITAEEAEDLKLEQTDEVLKRKAIKAEPAELPPEKPESQGGSDAAADAADAPDAATNAPPSSEPAPAPAKKAPPRGSGVTVR